MFPEGVPQGWAGTYVVAKDEAQALRPTLSGAEGPSQEGLLALVDQLEQKLDWVGDCQQAQEVSSLSQKIWLKAGDLTRAAFNPIEKGELGRVIPVYCVHDCLNFLNFNIAVGTVTKVAQRA